MVRTSQDLAAFMQQSNDTARRVLREVFPSRDEPIRWVLDEDKWNRVMNHLSQCETRRYGRRRRRC